MFFDGDDWLGLTPDEVFDRIQGGWDVRKNKPTR